MARDRSSNPRSFSIRCLLTAGRMLESSGDPDEIGVDNLRLNLKSVGIRDRANSKIFHKFEEIISSVSFSILWIILEKEFSKERKSGRLRSSKERNTCNCNFSASVRICSESRGLHFSTSWKVYIYILYSREESFVQLGRCTFNKTNGGGGR